MKPKIKEDLINTLQQLRKSKTFKKIELSESDINIIAESQQCYKGYSPRSIQREIYHFKTAGILPYFGDLNSEEMHALYKISRRRKANKKP